MNVISHSAAPLLTRIFIKRLPSLAAAILALTAATSTLNLAEPLSVTTDPRAGRLAAFFEAYHCPKPHYVQDYLRAADTYGLDYRLLPAISVRETTCGQAETRNNRWGYHPGRQRFDSIAEGIDFVARQLSENRPYAGKTLREKLFVYNPRRAYPTEVEKIMRQIE
jgi:hypothetical protein